MSGRFKWLAAEIAAKKVLLAQEFKGVMVACSAGPDSTALFHLLWDLSKAQTFFKLGLLHVAYELRGEESENDFAFVKSLSDAHGVSFEARRLTSAERAARPEAGIQSWARALRKQEFQRLGDEGWVIALAHHRDDVAETALFRLARGAGPGALAGMKVWEAPIWRPLLREKKADLLDYLREKGHAFRIDASNATDDYARNVIRHKVLPELDRLFPGAAGRIAATAEEAADTDPGSTSQAEKAVHAAIKRAGATSTRGEIRRAARTLMHVSGGQAMSFDVGGLSLLPVDRAAKQARSSQHRRNLGSLNEELWMRPGSHALLSHGIRRWRITLSMGDSDFSAGQETPIHIAIRTPKTGPTLRFCDPDTGHLMPRGFRLKELFQHWKIPDERRDDYLAIEYNKDLVGLFDGETLVLPAKDGTKRLIMHPNVAITRSN